MIDVFKGAEKNIIRLIKSGDKIVPQVHLVKDTFISKYTKYLTEERNEEFREYIVTTITPLLSKKIVCSLHIGIIKKGNILKNVEIRNDKINLIEIFTNQLSSAEALYFKFILLEGENLEFYFARN